MVENIYRVKAELWFTSFTVQVARVELKEWR